MRRRYMRMAREPNLTPQGPQTIGGVMRYALPALAFCAAIIMASTQAWAATPTWAVFDSRRAMEMTTHYKDAKAALEKELAAKQEVLEGRKKDLEGRREALDAKKAVSSSKDLVKEEGQLAREEQKLAQEFVQARRELALFEKKLRDQLFARLEMAIRVVASEKDNVFVIDASRVLYHVSDVDITKDVVAVYDKRFGEQPLDLSKVELSQAAGGK